MQTEAKEGDAQYTEDASQSQSRQWPVLQQKDRVSYPYRLKESLGSSIEDHGFSMKGFLLKVHGSCYMIFFLVGTNLILVLTCLCIGSTI